MISARPMRTYCRILAGEFGVTGEYGTYRTGLNPDVQRGSRDVTSVHVVAASTFGVNLGLDNCGPNHGGTSNEETSTHTLQRRESNLGLTQEWIDDDIEDGNHDDNTEGVKVVDQIVGDAVEFHGGGLGDEIAVDLVVCEPEQGIEKEDKAGFAASSNLVNPGIIKGHELGLVGKMRWLDIFPEVGRSKILNSRWGISLDFFNEEHA
jgi:hypothetical protein